MLITKTCSTLLIISVILSKFHRVHLMGAPLVLCGECLKLMTVLVTRTDTKKYNITLTYTDEFHTNFNNAIWDWTPRLRTCPTAMKLLCFRRWMVLTSLCVNGLRRAMPDYAGMNSIYLHVAHVQNSRSKGLQLTSWNSWNWKVDLTALLWSGPQWPNSQSRGYQSWRVPGMSMYMIYTHTSLSDLKFQMIRKLDFSGSSKLVGWMLDSQLPPPFWEEKKLHDFGFNVSESKVEIFELLASKTGGFSKKNWMASHWSF